MASFPDRPSSAGRPTSRQSARGRTAAPCRPAKYVHGLLLGQGLAWLAVAISWLLAWVASFPADLNLGGGGSVSWGLVDLLGIAIAGGIGAAQVGMACRMRGRPRLVVAIIGGLQNSMLALALIMAAVLVLVGGSLLELKALGGLVRAAVSRPRSALAARVAVPPPGCRVS